ncbi:ABC transporter substrate-binding protein [Salinarimonas soli]|uniref:ABC transporter substrate-binding protein n=1 Tax=Salinarimonas soli TaxID=1638099 RepID=A0A5B2V9T5_9HYPH|nr:ABC transporter substrate-binding protein [Salinarimonas soli]KAA2235200.1 ABC transporter substrate-binding protein [Salinarimonas soli]
MRSILAAGAIAIAALGLAPTHASAQSTLRIGLAEDPDVLDPTLARTYVGRIVFASICDKLFDIDAKLNIVPQLALSHETSADGREVTIKLRPNVRFHDGEPMDAKAVKFSLDRHLGMQGSFRRSELSVVDAIEVVDPTTVRLKLKAPFAPLLATLTDRAGMMVSPKAAEAAGDRFGAAPVCAGPYRFVERVQQDRIVVERFADYWDKDKVSIDRIVYRPIADSTVRLANLKAGQLDLIERPLATDVPEIKKDRNLTLQSVTELGYQGMTLNVANGDAAKNPLGQSAKVRRALELAIDRDAINQVTFNGLFTPANQWVAPDNAWYDKRNPVPGRDVAAAKKLLAEAGVKASLAIDFMVPNNPETRQVAEVIQAMAAEAGFDMKIRVVEFATGLSEAEQGRYQAFMLAWSGRPDPDGNIYSFAKTNGPLNYGKFSSPDLDQALEESRTATTREGRKAAYDKVADVWLKDGSVIYLYHRAMLIAHTNKLKGFTLLPDGMVRVVGLKMN